MNKLDLKIKSIALEDMKEIADYITNDNKPASLKMLKLFYKSFNSLCEHPEIGTIRKDFTYKDVRFLKVHKHYLIVYNFDKENIYILRVLSNYQNICELL